jgi:hypothetical protein
MNPAYSCPFVVPFLDKNDIVSLYGLKKYYKRFKKQKIYTYKKTIKIQRKRYNFPIRAAFLFNAIKNNKNVLGYSSPSPCDAHNKLQASCEALLTIFCTVLFSPQ